MDQELRMAFENLASFISEQMSPGVIGDIVRGVLEHQVKGCITEYIQREVQNLVTMTVRREVEGLKQQCEAALREIYLKLEENLEALKGFGQARVEAKVQVRSQDSRELVMSYLQNGQFNEGFKLFLGIQDESFRDLCLSQVNLIGLTALDEDVATQMADWALTRIKADLLLLLVEFIENRETVSYLLRKIVSFKDPSLGQVKSQLLKKSLKNN